MSLWALLLLDGGFLLSFVSGPVCLIYGERILREHGRQR